MKRLFQSHQDNVLSQPVFLKYLQKSIKPQGISVIFAPTVSGSSVISDKDIVTNIIGQNRNISGIDMETYGFFAAHRANLELKSLCFAIKSVCDFADSDKDDKFHTFSSNVSAILAFEFGVSLLSTDLVREL